MTVKAPTKKRTLIKSALGLIGLGAAASAAVYAGVDRTSIGAAVVGGTVAIGGGVVCDHKLRKLEEEAQKEKPLNETYRHPFI